MRIIECRFSLSRRNEMCICVRARAVHFAKKTDWKRSIYPGEYRHKDARKILWLENYMGKNSRKNIELIKKKILKGIVSWITALFGIVQSMDDYSTVN